jgi:hypothetical protein
VDSTLRRAVLCLLALALTGCVTREPTPQDLEAKRFIARADKAVVYLFRDRVDFSNNAVSFMLDEQHQGASYRGTYFRFELAPGRHRLAGFAGDLGRFDFTVDAAGIYFIRHSVSQFRGIDHSYFQWVAPDFGRAAVRQSELNSAP